MKNFFIYISDYNPKCHLTIQIINGKFLHNSESVTSCSDRAFSAQYIHTGCDLTNGCEGQNQASLLYTMDIIPQSWVWELFSCVIKFPGDFLSSSSNTAVGATKRQRSLQIICMEWETPRFLSLVYNSPGAFPILWSAHYVHSVCLPKCPYRSNNSRTTVKDHHINWYLGTLAKIVSLFI